MSHTVVENGVERTATPAEEAEFAAMQAEAAAQAPRLAALSEIDRLEKSITDRMWREDAIGSDLLMAIKKQDGTVDLDDPRTGKTATQYIGYVNSAIANIRAGL
jgi:hypothetical protein